MHSLPKISGISCSDIKQKEF